jgi:phosphodiesterase/alkaline phosphatase D-like protein
VLAPETPYFWRVIAKNETGTTEGKVETFTTLTVPVVTTAAAREVTRTGAVLSGTVDPLGVETSYVYVYATQQQYERGLRESPNDPYAFGMSTAEFSAGSANAVESAEPVTVERLTPGETYHYAILATATQSAPQGRGVKTPAVGPDQAFRTEAPLLPTVSEAGVGAVGQSEATLTAKLDPNGLPAHWELLLGTTPGQLQYRDSGTPSAETGQSALSVKLESLSSGTTYYYKLLLVGAEGSAESPEGSFMTLTGMLVQTLPLTVFPPVALLGVPAGAFPKEEAASKAPGAMKQTRAQKLKAALAKCGRQRSKKKRTACERIAHKRYGGTSKPKHARRRG